MKKLISLTSILGVSLLLTSLAFAHGGNYRGPGGIGIGGGFSPSGGGTPGPGPGAPGGGTTGGDPRGPGGVSGPGGGVGAPTGPGGGVRPGGAPGGGATPLGGATPGVRKPRSDFNTTWEAWWFVNDDRFLDLKARVRAKEAETMKTDLFLGEDTALEINKISAKKIRDGVLPTLRLALKDSHYDTRAAAAIALGKAGLPGDLAELESALSDRDKRVRESVALGIGILGDPEGVPTLIGIVENRAEAKKILRGGGEILPRTRAFAAIGIGLVGARTDISDTRGAATLMAMIEDEKATKAHADLAIAPMLGLGIMKAREAVPTLIHHLEDRSRDALTRSFAANALGKIGSRLAVPSLLEALKDKHASVAQSAAIALGQLLTGEDRKEVRSLQAVTSSSGDQATRRLALMSLAQIGGESNRQFIARFMTKGNTEERPFAALAAGVYCHEHPKDIESRRFLGDKIAKAFRSPRSPKAQGAYAVALGLLKHDDAAPSLMKALDKRGQASLRQHIVIGLGLMDYQKAIPKVREIVSEKGDVNLRRNAAIALGLLGDREAMAFLTAEIENSSHSLPVLGAVTQGLGFIGDAGAVPTLTGMVRDSRSKDSVRAFATVALGLLGDKDALPFGARIAENINYIQRTDAIRELLTIL